LLGKVVGLGFLKLMCGDGFSKTMDHSSYRKNFDLDKKNETITIAGKSILK
jgi:hypothetical protein